MLFICTLPCLLWVVNQLPFVQQYYANRLDDVLGEVEPVFLAGDNVGNFFLSPDGKWLYLATPYPSNDAKPAMMNMETYQTYTLDAPLGGGPAWIDDHHFHTGAAIIRVPDLTVWYLKPYFEPDKNALATLAQAKRIFAMEELIANGYWLISTDPKAPYMVAAHWTREELEANLAGLPYTIVPRKIWALGTGLPDEKFYSPDGRYYLTNASFRGNNSWRPLAIFDATIGKEVAIAEKRGWDGIFLGWATDSSGVYLQFRPAGAGYAGQPAGFPVYKLLVPGQHPSGKTPTFVEGTPPSKP